MFGNQSGGAPIAKTYGAVVLIALLALVALRQAFGSIRIEAGAR